MDNLTKPLSEIEQLRLELEETKELAAAYYKLWLGAETALLTIYKERDNDDTN